MAGHGYLTIPVLTDQLMPTSTKPWQSSQPGAGGAVPRPCAPMGVAAQPVQLWIPLVPLAWQDAGCCPFPLLLAGCLSPAMAGSSNAQSSFHWAQIWASQVVGEPAQHSTALQPFGKAALTLPEP